MRKPDNVTVVPSTSKNVFRKWLEFMRPYHKLTDREMDIAAAFIRHRFALSKVISDDTILDSVLLSEDTKKKIREECNITLPHFQVIMGKLRKSNIIVDGKLNPRYIPRVIEENGSFKLMLLFDFQ